LHIEIKPQSRGIVISVPCTLSSVCWWGAKL